jgi:hypothetical protein
VSAAKGSSPKDLFNVAADCVGPLIGGCAGLLVGGSLRALAGSAIGTVIEKSLNHFGKPILAAWWQRLRGLPPARQQAAVEELAGLSHADAVRQATAAVEQHAPAASSKDKLAAVTFLASIPAAARRTLIPDQRTGRSTCSARLLCDPNNLRELLPSDLPPLGPWNLPRTPYCLEEIIGRGGFGVVYRAKNSSVQFLDFAVKFCLDPHMKQSLINERDKLEKLLKGSQGQGWSYYVVKLCGFDFRLSGPVPGVRVHGRR